MLSYANVHISWNFHKYKIADWFYGVLNILCVCEVLWVAYWISLSLERRVSTSVNNEKSDSMRNTYTKGHLSCSSTPVSFLHVTPGFNNSFVIYKWNTFLEDVIFQVLTLINFHCSNITYLPVDTVFHETRKPKALSGNVKKNVSIENERNLD